MLTAAIVLGALITFVPGSEPFGKRAPALGLMETADITPAHFEVRGHHFVIPRNYFRYPPELDPEAEGGFLLRVLLPNLEPYTAKNAEEFDAPGFGRKMNLLVHNVPEIRPLDELLDVTLEGRALEPPAAATYWLSHAPKSKLRDELYVGVQAQGVSPYIRCDPIRLPFGSSCVHFFEFAGLDVQLTYDRSQLSQWQSIEEAVQGLLMHFEQPAAGDEGN